MAEIVEHRSLHGRLVSSLLISLRRPLGFYLRIGAAIALVLVILQWVDVRLLLTTLASADLRIVALIVALALLDRYLMAYKWAILVRARGNPLSNLEAFRIYLAAGFVGTFLPTGVGADAFRAVRTSIALRKTDRVTASIIVERSIGLLAVITIALIGLGTLVVNQQAQFELYYYSVWLFLAVFLAGLFLSTQRQTFNLIQRLLSRFQRFKLVRLYLAIHSAYIELSRHRTALLIFFALSCLEQFVLILMNFLAAKALGLPAILIYFVALIPITNVGLLLPISIGGIGVEEGIMMFLLSSAGLTPTEALSVSILMRIISWVMLIPGGLALLYDTVMAGPGRPSVKEGVTLNDEAT